jgi:hypothetical protein
MIIFREIIVISTIKQEKKYSAENVKTAILIPGFL